jgi:hypothetical protein
MPMYSEPQSTQNASVVQVNDRTPGMFKHSDEHDTAARTVSAHPGWRARSAGGYQSNGLGARRRNMAYKAGNVLPGLGSTWTDIRDAIKNTAANMIDATTGVSTQPPAAPAAPAVTYVPAASTVNKWLIPAGIAVAVGIAALVLMRRKR